MNIKESNLASGSNLSEVNNKKSLVLQKLREKLAAEVSSQIN